MKNLYLLIILMLFLLTETSGALVMKSESSSHNSLVKSSDTSGNVHHASKVSKFIHSTARFFHIPDPYFKPEGNGANHGLLSMIFGFVALFGCTVGLPVTLALTVPSIVLGVIGRKRKERFAKIGYALGVIAGFLILILIWDFFDAYYLWMVPVLALLVLAFAIKI